MTEDEARAWLASRFGRRTVQSLERFVAMVIDENQRQNLLSPASIASIWSRHVVDSAQLLLFAPGTASAWIDIGTGGGFPGVIVALLFTGKVFMVEPRRRRAAFLVESIDALGIGDRAAVVSAKIEDAQLSADVISARAVAGVEKLLQASAHCAISGTRWILPRGRTNTENLPVLANRFGVMFHVEHSTTDPEAVILLADRR